VGTGYFLRTGVDGGALGLWRIDKEEAIRIGVTNPKGGPGTYFRAEPDEDIWAAIRRGATSWFEPDSRNPFHELALAPGQYYPRIARPIDQHPMQTPGFYPGGARDRDAIAMGRGQLGVLVRLLDRVCETVHPDARNLSAFGHDIRNLLVLACTEVEAHWKGVLVANGVVRKRYKTADYVALQDAMGLGAYSVSLPGYPWLAAFAPFKAWGTTGQPTQELPWYNAYNATKHDRENAFHEASLLRAFEAVCACVVMMSAQYGAAVGLGQRRAVRTSFRLETTPNWPPEAVYTYPYETQDGWQPQPYPF
jgi:hypothetical protein